MYKKLHGALDAISSDGREYLLSDGLIGLEKESLRVDREGKISQLQHPIALGSSLTNQIITTDYSEALLEFITPPIKGVTSAISLLNKIHQFVYSQLNDELLWGASMPCVVDGEESIPVAQYGKSNLGLMKTIYRRGLGYRYGKMMQVIAGVHFNFSLQENFWPYYLGVNSYECESIQKFISDQYFGLIRNLQRYGWLIFYLFGASPAICNSFLKGQPTKLDSFDETTSYLPYATTLRMGDIGYTNKKEYEFGIKACYDSLPSYIKCLTHAIETPCPEFEKIGVKVSGEYRQLSPNILQIENEYYSTIRPKQPSLNNEKPTHALSKRGVQYIELRSLDLDLHEPLGVRESQLHFLEAFMIFCLLKESPLISKDEQKNIDQNENDTAHNGRNPELKLIRDNKKIAIREWGLEILNELSRVCEILDSVSDNDTYMGALNEQVEKIKDANKTPSASILEEMRKNKESFFEMAYRLSTNHKDELSTSKLSQKDINFFTEKVRQSVHKQQCLEESDKISFDQFLQDYFAEKLDNKVLII